MRRAGLKVSLYGQPKTGKTRLMCTFPKPLVILGSEDGTASIQNVEGVTFLRVIGNMQPVPLDDRGQEITNYLRLQELGDWVKEVRASSVASIGVDTASILSDIVLADVMGIVEVPQQKSWGFATREQYGAQSLQMRTVLSEILGTGRNVICTAHEKNFNDEGGGDDVMAPVIGSSLSQKLCAWLNGAVDYVCQTFKRPETKARIVKTAGVEKEVMMKTGGAEYCLRVGPHPIFMTGFRLPAGFELPDVIINPTYQKILDVIEGKGVK